MIEVFLEGLQTPGPPEDRGLLLLKVIYNDEKYDWSIYIPQDKLGDIGSYIIEATPLIKKQIDNREAEWAAHPKEKTIVDLVTGENTIVPVDKSEIVIPYIPDYYALRRAEYPSLGEQLGALLKGPESQDYIDIVNKITEIKQKYPKP